MLDDLELPQVQEITTLERRALAEHKPPSMSGSLLQNLGRRPTRLTLWGVATGPEALNFVEQLDDKFRANVSVSFTADIVTEAEIEKMVIDDLHVQELAGKPERYAYVLTLREYIEPVEPEDTSELDTSILDDTLGQLDNLMSGFEVVQQLSDIVGRLAALTQTLQQQSNQLRSQP
ncbi:MAG TPA: hypothetical protein VFR47_05660 [Anaerolineales bacterium]|nr:hypothetical protein [Anaerolineales bacterium]